LVEDKVRVKNRVLKVLEDGNVKLASVVSDPFGKAGMQIMKALANGSEDTQSILEEAKIGRPKWEVFRKSLVHCFRSQHRFLLAELLLQLFQIEERVEAVEKELANKTQKHEELISRLEEIPGVSRVLAQGIVAEATTKMENFKDDRVFAAWAGVAPGNNESAGKKKRARTRHGNPALKKILIQAANGAVKTRATYYHSKFNSLTLKTGSRNKAKVAIANRLARAIYHIIAKPGQKFRDIGPQRVNSQARQIQSLIRKLREEGVSVDFELTQKIVKAKQTVEVRV
jgi:transposase